MYNIRNTGINHKTIFSDHLSDEKPLNKSKLTIIFNRSDAQK